MLATSLHWVGALTVAVVVHAMGLAWFDPQSAPLPKPNTFSEEVVVVLGEGSGKSTELAALLEDPTSVSGVRTPEEVTEDRPSNLTEPSVDHNQVEVTVTPPAGQKVENPPSVPSSTPEVAVLEQNSSADSVQSMQSDDVADAVSIDSTVEPTQSAASDTREVTAEQLTTTESTNVPAVDLERPDTVAHTVIAPTQLISESSEPTALDVVQAQDAPRSRDTVLASVVPNDEQNIEQQPEQAAVDPVSAVPVVKATVESRNVSQAGVEGAQPAVVSEIEPAVRNAPEPAVVLEFDSVEAVTVNSTVLAEPQAVPTVSIEEQIARALSIDESQSLQTGEGIVARYAGELKGRLEESMYYPRAARLAGQEGRVVVRFVIDRNGTVLSIVVEKASGHTVLDREAVEMIERGEPYPVMPEEMVGDVLELRVPIAYQIREESRTRDIPPINLE